MIKFIKQMIRVEEHHVVTITYELRDGNAAGEMMERMDANYPFTFLFGSGALLPEFEQNLYGLTERDSFEFILKAEDAYGEIEKGNILDIPRSVFQVDGVEPPNLLVKDNFVRLTDDEGNHHNGKILDFNDFKVKVDFNHVMAGKDLHFKGAILNIRKATVDELIRQHYIPEGA